MFLYLRMLVSIAVNLYTVRVLWNVLGVDDYGIFNVVGGIVMMFAFLNNAMVASSQRYISFSLGKGDRIALQHTFSISVAVHFLLSMAILLLAETVGLWFLNTKLNIPDTRYVAANWVYQCSVISFLITVISVPYNACIVAHEHMKVYGYFGILDVILKLVIVLIVAVLPFDRLIGYAILLLVESAVMRLIYGVYCKFHFEECRYSKVRDIPMMKEMFSFAGWSFVGNMGFSLRDQGLNIIINMFFSVAVNAAKGIANQISQVITGFASNFTMAINPQITKRYASGQTESMMELVTHGCKYSIMLLSVVVIPLAISAERILILWLGDIAQYMVGFLQLALVLSLFDYASCSPVVTAMQATGKIRKFQTLISIIMMANLPVAWIWLKLDANPYVVMYTCIASAIIGLVTRVKLLHDIIPFSYKTFYLTVYGRTIPCMGTVGISLYFLYRFFPKELMGLIAFFIVSIGIIIAVYFTIALSTGEKKLIYEGIKRKFHL